MLNTGTITSLLVSSVSLEDWKCDQKIDSSVQCYHYCTIILYIKPIYTNKSHLQSILALIKPFKKVLTQLDLLFTLKVIQCVFNLNLWRIKSNNKSGASDKTTDKCKLPWCEPMINTFSKSK